MSKALAKAKPQTALLGTTVLAFEQALIRLRNELHGELAPQTLAGAYDKLTLWSETVEAFRTHIKQQLTELLDEQGETTTEKGSKSLTVGSYKLEARPWRTGFDAKKVEALLRAKSADVERWMDMEVQFKLNEGKLRDAITKGVLTADEAETCKYERKLVLQPPTKVQP